MGFGPVGHQPLEIKEGQLCPLGIVPSETNDRGGGAQNTVLTGSAAGRRGRAEGTRAQRTPKEGEVIGVNPRAGRDPVHQRGTGGDNAVCVLGRRDGHFVDRRGQNALGRKLALPEPWARPPHPGSHRAGGPSSPRRPGGTDEQASRSGSGVDREGAEKMRPLPSCPATSPKPPRTRPAPERDARPSWPLTRHEAP